ncbi:MAG: hypothetical protein J6N45_01255 [Alphaproteobacteria bacterium]|nr:hypothetical protein [Alphaproteobacteria bacterium]
MFKKLVAGEYSLAKTFWLFGVVGFFVFMLITGITHSSFAHAVCGLARNSSRCVQNINVLYYIMSNFINLLLRGGSIATLLMLHLIASGCFGAYAIIVLRGLWKSAKSYEGSKVWAWLAKIGIVGLVLFSLRLIL